MLNRNEIRQERSNIIHKMDSKSQESWIFKLIPDLFGRDINLMYEENNRFKTLCGVTFTLLLVSSVSVPLFFEIFRLFRQDLMSLNYYETSINQNSHGSLLANKLLSPSSLKVSLSMDDSSFEKGLVSFYLGHSSPQKVACSPEFFNGEDHGKKYSYCFRFPSSAL